MKLVVSSSLCSGTVPALAVANDLGPSNSNSETTATATMQVADGGVYKLCYRMFGNQYDQVIPRPIAP